MGMDDLTYTILSICYNLKRFTADKVTNLTIINRSTAEVKEINDMITQMMMRGYFEVDKPTTDLKLNKVIEGIYLAEKENKKKRQDRDDMQHELNVSQKKLNDSLGTTNVIQVILTIAIVIATATQATVAYLDFSTKKKHDTSINLIETDYKSLRELLIQKTQSDNIFFQQVKDSLKIP